jgi:hypothetical protein
VDQSNLPEPQGLGIQKTDPRRLKRLKILAVLMTVGAVALFGLLLRSIEFDELLNNIEKIGWMGLAVLVLAHVVRFSFRAFAWKLSVHEPYELSPKDTIPGVLMGEAMSSLIPLGPIISGTTKVLSVAHRIPLVVGFSSITTENLFYTNMTAMLIGIGGLLALKGFEVAPDEYTWIIDGLIAINVVIILFAVVLIVRQWHILSETCEFVYKRGYFTRLLEHTRLQVRLFENFFFDFFRRHTIRIPVIMLCQVGFHSVGLFEVWFILSLIAPESATLQNAFIFEAVNRAITVIFKLVPFKIGVAEAGGKFVAGLVMGKPEVGVALEVIRKGPILIWTAIGTAMVVNRGIHQAFKPLTGTGPETETAPAEV